MTLIAVNTFIVHIVIFNPICLPNERMSENQYRLSNEETTMLRGVLGQLNWIANMTRPDISYTVSSLSSCITHATIADIKTANKAVKFVKGVPPPQKKTPWIMTLRSPKWFYTITYKKWGILAKKKNSQSTPRARGSTKRVFSGVSLVTWYSQNR